MFHYPNDYFLNFIHVISHLFHQWRLIAYLGSVHSALFQ
jgi:hypothetical protein